MALSKKPILGFSLVELVVGIVVFGVVLVGLMNPFFSMVQSSVEPILEAKSAILAAQITKRLNTISYDENSDHDGGRCRCGEEVNLKLEDTNISVCPFKVCTPYVNFGIDNDFEKNVTTMDGLNDFDDFDTDKLCQKTQNEAVKKLCKKDEAISSLCANYYCLSAEFFILNDFKNATQLRKLGALFDSGFENFFVSINISEKTFDTDNVFNKSNKKMRLKYAQINIISPRGNVYKHELYRGNY